MLSGNCSKWSTGIAYIPWPTVTVVKWCHTVMQTMCQHKEGGLVHKKTRDWENDKYTYPRGEFTVQSNIHAEPFKQK